jgi:hypothetical protein
MKGMRMIVAPTSTIEPSSIFTSYLLGQLTCAGIRARLLTAEIDTIRVALRGNFITPDGAIEWLHEAGGLGLVTVSSALTGAST